MDHGDEMKVYGGVQFVSVQFSAVLAGQRWKAGRRITATRRIVRFVTVQFTSVLAELERTARGTDGNRRVPPSDGG